VIKTAEISECGLYRYHLGRSWDASLPSLTFVMLNPSTADADIDDPTIRRCIGFAKREGCGSINVVNLFAYRATDPSALKDAADPVGPFNPKWLQWTLDAARQNHTTIVCAWGAHPLAEAPGDAFINQGPANCAAVCHLGLTKGGHPRHPLYIKGDQPLELFI
jgi:hypothetical protein